MPYLVVAPIKVKGFRDRFMLRAFRPLSITQVTKKSSMAGYRTSSTTLFSLWISSMNRMSSCWSWLRMATMSPGRSIAGPDVVLIRTPISEEIMFASVVFPKPGGP